MPLGPLRSLQEPRFVERPHGDLDYIPKVLVYGGMKVTWSGFKGMYGARTLCIDIKDDETERFFINLVETLLRVGGGCINERTLEDRISIDGMWWILYD